MGPRIRPGRLTESEDDTRATPESERRCCADSSRGRRILSGRVLVFYDADSRQEGVHWCGLERKRDSSGDEESALLERHAEEFMPVVSCAGLKGCPHISK